MWAGGGCGNASMLGRLMNGNGEPECEEALAARLAAAILFACGTEIGSNKKIR